MVLPWSDFWERNYFAQSWPFLTTIIGNSFVRGGVTGLGFANLMAGVAELAGRQTIDAPHVDNSFLGG